MKTCLTGKIKLGSHPDPTSPGPPYSAAARIKRYKPTRVLSNFQYVLIIESNESVLTISAHSGPLFPKIITLGLMVVTC